MLRTTLISALALSLAAGAALADITNITQGTTHTTIQDAIDQSIDGDEIVVDPGEYFENLDMLGRQITLRSQDPTDPATVIATIINGGDNGPVVRFDNGETPDTVISGFVITNGHSGGGGGMDIYDGSPTITHCSFVGNLGFAGGIFAIFGSPTIAHCSFSENTAPGGGGGAIRLLSEAVVAHCSFTDNFANEGGALALDSDGVTVTDCFFANNSAEYSGGAVSSEFASILTNCSFTNNSAGTSGGAVDINGGALAVIDCSFTNNAAQGSGGAICILNANPTLTNCSFTNNSAQGSGGGLYARHIGYGTSELTISGCWFTGNTTAMSGGGLALEGGSLMTTLRDTIVCGNSPEQIYVYDDYTDGGGNAIGIYIPPPAVPPAPCPEDINGDGVIDQADLGALLAMYGQSCP